MPNPHGLPSSDVLRPWINGEEIAERWGGSWIIDFSTSSDEATASAYEQPFGQVKKAVVAVRKTYKTGGKLFWKFERPRPAMRLAFAPFPRFLARSMVGKHQFYRWLDSSFLPANLIIAFARTDDYFFGVLHSRFHEVWALAQGTQLREKESGFRYTPTTCFETFPFPFSDDLQPPEPAPVKPPPKSEKRPEPDRFYAENLAAKNYYMGKEEPPPYGSRSRREEAGPLLTRPAFRCPHLIIAPPLPLPGGS